MNMLSLCVYSVNYYTNFRYRCMGILEQCQRDEGIDSKSNVLSCPMVAPEYYVIK